MSSHVTSRVDLDLEAFFLARLAEQGFRDGRRLLKSARKESRAKGRPFNGAHWAAIRWFDYRRRVIYPASRATHVSSVLAARVLTPMQRRALAAIVKASEAGEWLRPFQSTKLERLNGYDLLFNDLGIHHLHLGVGPHEENPGYRQRSGAVLFVVVSPRDLYCVDVDAHEAMHDARSLQLLEVVHREWPHAIAHGRLESVTGVDSPVHRERQAAFRKAKILTLATVSDGTAYGMIGGGITGDGTNLRAIQEANALMNAARRVEAYVRERADELLQHVRYTSGHDVAALELSVDTSRPHPWPVIDHATRVPLGYSL